MEARIEELETRDKEIDETMVLPDVCTNVAECTKLSREKAAIAEELEGLYERWGGAGVKLPVSFYTKKKQEQNWNSFQSCSCFLFTYSQASL